jgi:hypothetical protein
MTATPTLRALAVPITVMVVAQAVPFVVLAFWLEHRLKEKGPVSFPTDPTSRQIG